MLIFYVTSGWESPKPASLQIEVEKNAWTDVSFGKAYLKNGTSPASRVHRSVKKLVVESASLSFSSVKPRVSQRFRDRRWTRRCGFRQVGIASEIK